MYYRGMAQVKCTGDGTSNVGAQLFHVDGIPWYVLQQSTKYPSFILENLLYFLSCFG